MSCFPADWEDLAAVTGANAGLRGLGSVEGLLRTLLVHGARGYALREPVVRARRAGVARVSAVALVKRLRRAEGGLQSLGVALVQEQGVVVPQADKPRAIRLVESTTSKEPGKTGSLWRGH